MKWIKNFLIATVAALSMSGVCANEISVDEISHAARVSADPVDITNVNLFDIGSNDQSNDLRLLYLAGSFQVWIR